MTDNKHTTSKNLNPPKPPRSMPEFLEWAQDQQKANPQDFNQRALSEEKVQQMIEFYECWIEETAKRIAARKKQKANQ